MSDTKTIALDADGVLLDYAKAYATAWAKYSGTVPIEQDPHAYWPMQRWGVPQLSGRALETFRAHFDEVFWRSIPAVGGALEACELLASNGYELVCVTALDARYAQARTQNLLSLGFPITRVITTSLQAPLESPKAAVLRKLKPLAFVDDFGPYFAGVDPGIHKALVARDPNGSPNTQEVLRLADSQHQDLHGFARWWLEVGSVEPLYAEHSDQLCPVGAPCYGEH